MKDLDTKNRPLREAARRWGLLRGVGLGQHWDEGAQMWFLSVGKIEVRVDVNGNGWIEGEAGLATSAKGMTMLLNRHERAAMSRAECAKGVTP